jgi:hypothetical protein
VLGVKPSALDEVFWTHSYRDLETLVAIKTEYEVAVRFQEYESLRLAIAEALGGTTSSSSVNEEEAVTTREQLMAAFSAVGGMVGQ